MGRPPLDPSKRKDYGINLGLTEEARAYVYAIALVRGISETDMLRDLIDEFIQPNRGDPEVEQARETVIRYGLIKPKGKE